MKQFVPDEKLSKKKQRELNKQKRGSWGDLNPVTRKSEHLKAYNRKKARQRWSDSDRRTCLLLHADGSFFGKMLSSKLPIAKSRKSGYIAMDRR